MCASRPLTVFAPAKINLYLHVTGKQDDGYHLLDSLAVFADIGDKITFEAANEFGFQIAGPYAAAFMARDRDSSPGLGAILSCGRPGRWLTNWKRICPSASP